MIAQIFNCGDSEFLDYLIHKYEDKSILRTNYVIEIRYVSIPDYNDSEYFLKDFILNKNLLISRSDENTLDLLFLIDSISSAKQYFDNISKFGTNRIISEILRVLSNYNSLNIYKIGNKLFNFTNAYLMGIINVTPDSFSDGGKYFNVIRAVDHALQMLDEGVDIIDIGGESTRPGSEPVSADEEMNRVIPVIREILDKKPDAIISIDTYKSKVASAALESGAKIVNDISGFTFDPEIADVCNHFKANVILMHIKGTPKTMQNNTSYKEVISDIYDFLKKQTDFAMQKGIKNIIIDPGIGFGKSVKDNFKIIKRLKDFKSLGFPILVGVSRKSFIGKTLDLDTHERDLPTAAIEAIAVFNSARIIRTHNVKNGKQIIKLLSEII